MKIRYQQFPLPGGQPGPVGQIVAALVAIVVIASALVLGFVFFVVIFGLLVFAWLAFVLRRWVGSGRTRNDAPGAPAGSRDDTATLEGEFRVVEGKPDSSASSGRDDSSNQQGKR